jgi:hypothetical protein
MKIVRLNNFWLKKSTFLRENFSTMTQNCLMFEYKKGLLNSKWALLIIIRRDSLEM